MCRRFLNKVYLLMMIIGVVSQNITFLRKSKEEISMQLMQLCNTRMQFPASLRVYLSEEVIRHQDIFHETLIILSSLVSEKWVGSKALVKCKQFKGKFRIRYMHKAFEVYLHLRKIIMANKNNYNASFENYILMILDHNSVIYIYIPYFLREKFKFVLATYCEYDYRFIYIK